MAAIASADVQIDLTTPEGVLNKITFDDNGTSKGLVNLEAKDLVGKITMTLHGAVGEAVAGWKFGIVQLKHVSTDWAYYRGETNAQGSTFIALDRPPARPQQLCRDSITDTTLFYDPDEGGPLTSDRRRTYVLEKGTTIPKEGKLTVGLLFWDKPTRYHDTIVQNDCFSTPVFNYLREVEFAAAFCTVLAAQDPQGTLFPLKHFVWNVGCQASFARDPATGKLSPVRTVGVKTNVGARIHSGGPSDPRFAHQLTNPKLPNCNVLVRAARKKPVKKCAKIWENFDVRHPAE